jgi:hypothetical protein
MFFRDFRDGFNGAQVDIESEFFIWDAGGCGNSI